MSSCGVAKEVALRAERGWAEEQLIQPWHQMIGSANGRVCLVKIKTHNPHEFRPGIMKGHIVFF